MKRINAICYFVISISVATASATMIPNLIVPVADLGTGSARAVFQYTRARHPYNMSELLQKSAVSRGRNPLAGAEQDQAV
ncbi:MAG: hypothetical protein RBT03_02745, partial [Kiritimatiellia bacterium]|nr:hypothetical protein [Kiritimatiellia bacterium]